MVQIKIDFVIPVRNRGNKRIQRCIDSLKSDITGKIIVVDYGSITPIDVKDCEIIREYTSNIWNKSHAINIGIKKCSNKFIGTIDCDTIIGKDFLDRCKRYLRYDSFIFTRMVKRINPEILDWGLSKERVIKLSTDWFTGKQTNLHQAVGGVQIFPKWWIHKIHGYDENLIYWGGIDNDIHERAFRTGLAIVDLNEIIFHQEHSRIKEANLDSPEERVIAKNERTKRRIYLMYKWNRNIDVGPEIWGESGNPQQSEINIQNEINVKNKIDVVERIKEQNGTAKNEE